MHLAPNAPRAFTHDFAKFVRCASFSRSSTLECTQLRRLLNSIPQLTSLAIDRASPYTFQFPKGLNGIRLDALTSLILEGYHNFIEGWLGIISAPGLIALRVICPQVDTSERIFELIGAMHSLHHLHFELHSYDGE